MKQRSEGYYLTLANYNEVVISQNCIQFIMEIMNEIEERLGFKDFVT